MKKVQRLFVWLLIVVTAVMFAACGNWNLGMSPVTSTPVTQCCPAGQQYYACSAQVQVSTVQLMGMGDGPGVETRCFTNTDCESTQDEAQKSVLAAAQLNYSQAMTQIVTVQTVECKPSGNCATTQPQDYFQPLDFPGACNQVVVVADAGASCIAGSDPCSTCLDACCDQYAACVSAQGEAVCQRVIGYWQGAGPAPEGASDQTIDDLNACASSNCGDLGACTAYLLRHDGGLGFGGGGSGAGGGTP